MSENGSTYELLFSEFQLGRLRLRNRMVGLPHGTAHIQLGVPDDEDLAYWERRAKGGAALITVGGSIVHPTTRLLNRWLNEVYNPAAFSQFDPIGHILLVPGTYLVIAALQNNLVSPLVYGQRLKLNPVAVLVGVLFWWLLWGVAGAFLAVPFFATLKILADHVESLTPIATFLGE